MICNGTIAVCGMGRLGLVMEDEPRLVKYPDGNSGVAYVGISLEKDSFGRPWSSRNPKVVCQLCDLRGYHESNA